MCEQMCVGMWVAGGKWEAEEKKQTLRTRLTPGSHVKCRSSLIACSELRQCDCILGEGFGAYPFSSTYYFSAYIIQVTTFSCRNLEDEVMK